MSSTPLHFRFLLQLNRKNKQTINGIFKKYEIKHQNNILLEKCKQFSIKLDRSEVTKYFAKAKTNRSRKSSRKSNRKTKQTYSKLISTEHTNNLFEFFKMVGKKKKPANNDSDASTSSAYERERNLERQKLRTKNTTFKHPIGIIHRTTTIKKGNKNTSKSIGPSPPKSKHTDFAKKFDEHHNSDVFKQLLNTRNNDSDADIESDANNDIEAADIEKKTDIESESDIQSESDIEDDDNDGPEKSNAQQQHSDTTSNHHSNDDEETNTSDSSNDSIDKITYEQMEVELQMMDSLKESPDEDDDLKRCIAKEAFKKLCVEICEEMMSENTTITTMCNDAIDMLQEIVEEKFTHCFTVLHYLATHANRSTVMFKESILLKILEDLIRQM